MSGDTAGADADPHPRLGSPGRNFEIPESLESLAPVTDKAHISGGIWPVVGYTGDGQLEWSYQAADNPRVVGIRLAALTDMGGTPTEVAAIGPEGHIDLKQPQSCQTGIRPVAKFRRQRRLDPRSAPRRRC